MRAATFVEDLGQVPLHLPAAGQEDLGTCFGQELHFEGEISRRIGAATTAFRQIARPILGNKHVSTATIGSSY